MIPQEMKLKTKWPPIFSGAPLRMLLKRFALIYLPIVIVLSVILLISVRLDDQIQQETRKNHEMKEIKIFQERVKENFEMINSELRIIAKLPILRSYLDSGSQVLRAELAQFLLEVVKEKRVFDKVRFLDVNGHEVIRINYNAGKPAIVPPEKLQDKSDRYFFRDTFRRSQGEIYVSPLDLNVEEDRLEIPYKPTIRFGIPVFDRAGRKKGIILINYFGNVLLQDFHNTMRVGDHHAMVLNRDGYWLANSANNADEWGFMLGKLDRTFGHDFVDEWRRISTNEEETLRTAKGLFIYATIHPLVSREISSSGTNMMLRDTSQGELTSQEYYWKIVSFTPQAVLSDFHFYHHTSYRILLVFIYLLLALFAWFAALFSLNRKQIAKANKLLVEAAAFNTDEAIMITDTRANIIRVNRAFQEITGYSQEEVLGKNPRILKSGRHDQAFYTAMWEQLLNTGSWEGEIWDRRKNGETYPKRMSITALKNEHGETTEYVSISSDITAHKRAEEEIRTLAFYDSLTKLPNRRFLLERFQAAFSLSARNNYYGALLFLDMDRFKTINDTLGHDFGDLMLIEVARRIKSCLREMDTVVRLGGDEFVVLVEEISTNSEEATQKAAIIAEKIRKVLAIPYRIKDHQHHSSSSMGVCLFRGYDESADALLKHADIAMYRAKDSGRNRVQFFDPAMQQAVEEHVALEEDLRQAVRNQKLQLYYQIQVDNDQRPLGVEALVRWLHPERGLISPAQFISIAEESSLMLEIGQWVLETACKQLALWDEREQRRGLTLAINVSARQFKEHDFVEKVAVAIRTHRVNPAHLKLELTESVVLNNVSEVVVRMHALKALGIKLSMDDFGTGYSSLSYLKQLPLDQIKIDQSFVRDVTIDCNVAKMVQTIISLAQNFHLNVIAEGVESEAQLDFLKNNGCMAYQGYLFSKPVPLDEFESLLKRFSKLTH